jgi:hypothetical protein
LKIADGNVGKMEVKTKGGLERIGDIIVRKTLNISGRVRRWRRLKRKRGRRRSGTRLETRIVRLRKELIAKSRNKTRFEETDKA